MHVKVVVEITDARRTYPADTDVPDMPDDQAQRWIAAGWAEAVGGPGAPEAAAVAPAPETGTLERGQKR